MSNLYKLSAEVATLKDKLENSGQDPLAGNGQ